MTVAAKLLQESRSAHAAYRRVSTAGGPGQVKCDLLAKALTLRERAHESDPEHTDPAWAEDKAPHDELMAFYRRVTGLQNERSETA